MNFVSIEFILVLLVGVLIYYLLPNNHKKYFLILSNVAFLLTYNIMSAVFVLVLAVLSFFSAKYIDKASRYRNIVFIVSVMSVIVAIILSRILKIKKFVFWGNDIWQIIGLSFWGLQILGYLFDVFNRKYSAEKNFIDYFLYVSFFAYITSGPIERADHILPQIKTLKTSLLKIEHGIQLCLWGIALKLILGERLAMIADTIYNNYSCYAGSEILGGVLAYSLQIYCDFFSYSCLACGIAETLGIHLLQNFEQPYFSKNIAEFWRRWHISLSGWLRDYIYIPLGGNRKGTFRKYMNVVIVFLVSGIWHGTGLQFLCWGGIHAVYQIAGALTDRPKKIVMNKLRLNKEADSYKILQIVVTFLLASFAWIFFRAPSVKDAYAIIKRMIVGFDISLWLGNIQLSRMGWHFAIGENLVMNHHVFWKNCGFMNMADIFILFGGLGVLFLVDYLHYTKFHIRNWIDNQNGPFRWIAYIGVIVVILVFGIYGSNYDAASFIYSNF